jgi:ribosomal protein S18 acetylase RimI-like enzyme
MGGSTGYGTQVKHNAGNCLGCCMEFIIRPAISDDYDAVGAIYAEIEKLHRVALPQIFRAPDGPALSREYFEMMLVDERATWLVAAQQGELLGFVTVRMMQAPERPMLQPRGYAEVNNLAVRETYRRLGIGQALQQRAEQWAAERQLSEVELNVWEFNQAAVAFYEKLGYVTQRRTMWRSMSHANS